MIFRLLFTFLIPIISWSQEVGSLKKNYDDKKIETNLSEEEKKAIRESYLKSDNDVELAVKLLRLDLAPYLTTLNRDILTYNYRKVSELGFDVKTHKSSDTPEAIKYAKKWALAAKSHNAKETGVLGWGLYSARDPITSSGYGKNFEDEADKSFGLVTVKYPKNSKMLDLRNYEYFFSISEETFGLFKKICPSLVVSFSGTGKQIEKKHLTKEKPCQEIYAKALESLGIDGIIYEYSSNSSKYCDSTVNASAFVAFNLPINDQNIDFYTKLDDVSLKLAAEIQAEANPKKREKLIKSFPLGEKTFRDYEKMSVDQAAIAGEDSLAEFSPKDHFKPFTPTDPKLIKEYTADLKKHAFGCSKEYEEQDKPTYKPEQVWDILLEDTVKLNLNKAINDSLDKCIENSP